MAIVEPVIVDVHPLGEARVVVALDFDVGEHVLLLAVAPPDFHQLVGDALAELGVADDLLQLLVLALVAPGPVDAAVGFGEEEGQEVGEVSLEHLLPGAVVGVGHARVVGQDRCQVGVGGVSG